MTTRSSARKRSDAGADTPRKKHRADDLYETVPLVVYDGANYTVPDEAVAFLTSLGSVPLAVASLAGPYRSGKSLLLNRVVLDAPVGKGFTVGGTIQACTKGLHICKKLLPASNASDGDYQVLVLDTEGLGDVMASTTRDARIFSLALLLSSLFIYNSKGTIDQMAIETLGLVANISNHIRTSSEDGDGDDLSQFFPGFMWIVRDFALELVDEGGSSIDQADYLERALVPIDGADPEKNKVRNCIRGYFRHRDCATLVRPCTDEKQLQNLNAMPFEQFRPEFQAQARALRKKIIEQARPKHACGTKVTGALLAKLAQVYCTAINAGKAPAIKDSWTLISADECQRASREAMGAFEAIVAETTDGTEAVSSNRLETSITRGFEAARDTFKRLAVGDQATAVLDRLRDQLRARGEALRVRNRAVLAGLVEDEFSRLEATLLDQDSWADANKAHDRARDQFFKTMGRDAACQASWNTELSRRAWNWAGRFLAHLGEECKVQRVTVRSLEDKGKAADRDRDRHEAAQEKLARRLDEATEAAAAAAQQLRAAEGSLASQGSEVAQLQLALTEAADQHTRAMQQLHLKVNEATSEASQATAALETLRSQHGEQTLRLEEADRLLLQAAAAHGADKEKLVLLEERASLVDGLERQRLLDETNVADLKSRLEQEAIEHRAEMAELHEKSRDTISDIKKTREGATGRAKAAEAALAALQSQHTVDAEAHRAQRRQADADAKAARQRHDADDKAAQQAHAVELKEARHQHEAELRGLKQSLMAESKDLGQQLKVRAAQCAEAEARAAAAESSLDGTTRRLDQLKAEHKERAQELKQQMAQMAQKAQKQMEELSQAHREELRVKAQKSREEHDQLFQKQMDAATQAQKAEGAAAQAQSLLVEARDALTREREKFREGNYQARITDLESKLSSERTRANMLQQSMDSRSDTVADQQAQISDLEARLRTIDQKHRAEIMAMELKHERQLGTLEPK